MAFMLLITVGCAVLSSKVDINEDMTKYLPDDSSMKQGMDIMSQVFPETETTNTIRVMVQDLTSAQKKQIHTALENLEYVDSVDYDDGEDYNKENQTLYKVNTVYEYGSAEENALEDQIGAVLEGYTAVVKNNDTSIESIPLFIMIAALAILMAVLWTMCGSWVEPILFLLTIGFAVVINAGTNYFLGSVSSITNMIAALLQLVLSMDYSIILMNRYRQELSQNSNREEAMSVALAHACSSIASSSVTTIVGLLALVFMSFKIGMDLGVVLAKGVLISMICVFTVLPGLILICTKLIQKTAKKVPHIPMGGLSRFSYKFRLPVAIAFVILFAGSYILQGGTQTAFTLASEDPIAEIFPNTNTLVLVYHNEDDDIVTKLAEELVDKDDQVKAAVSYSTMLGKQYSAEELADSLSTMSDDLSLDPELLKILYYDYYCANENVTMTASELLHFLADDMLTNDLVADQLDGDMVDKIDLMMEFADADKLTEKKTIGELADIFGMDADQVEKLMLLYYTSHDGADMSKMTLPVFADFVADEVAENADYSSMFDSDTLSMMQTLKTFTNKKKMTTPYSYQIIAQMLGMDEDTAKLLFVYYYAMQDDYNPGTMTMAEFVSLIGNVAKNPMFSGYLDESMMSQVSMLAAFTDKEEIQAQKTSAELAQMLGMDSTQLRQLYLLYQTEHGDTSSWGISLDAFVDFIQDEVLSNETYAGQMSGDAADLLNGACTLMDAVLSGEEYDAQGLTKLFAGLTDKIDENTMELLTMVYGSRQKYDSEWTLSIHQLFDHLSNNILNDSRFESFLDDEVRDAIAENRSTIDDGVAQLKGDEYSRLILSTTYSDESEETSQFINKLVTRCDGELSEEYYLIGSSAMNYEMENSFDREMMLITWITAISIFLVVAITFKSVIIPLILVLTVQCGVYITVSVIGFQGYSIYYLALLIVQSILMGATIDYGILYTNYYLENRRNMSVKEALLAAYNGSIHTILTSGLILILVTGIVGNLFTNPTVGQICKTISTGALSASLLILFMLPAILAVMDRVMIRQKKS